jgi:hypothetical protein
MCQSVYFKDQNKWVGTVQELADFLKVKPTDLDGYEGQPLDGPDFNYCLCPVDIEASLGPKGYTCSVDHEMDSMCVVATQNT